jgi:L-lactate dehydrogenase complex protein LldG
LSRETFLARVRAAAESGRAYRVHHAQIPPDAGYVGGGADLVKHFADEVTAAGGLAHIVEDLPGARSVLSEIIAGASIRSALCWQHPLLERLGLSELLAGFGIEALSYDGLSLLDPDERRARLLAADIGITSVMLAVAETGSALVNAGPGTERLASLLPPLYVTVVASSQLVPDLFDAFTKLGELPDGMPSNLVFITGPSKTGDIELKLTTGVHGPGVWHVIVLR